MQLHTILCEQPNPDIGGTLKVMPLATVAVYSDVGVDTVLASIFDEDGNALANPATADANGKLSFQAANGVYDIIITSADTLYTTTLPEVAFLDPADPIAVPGVLQNKGGWNATTNTPSLADGTGTDGWVYTVTVAGTTSLDGIDNWEVGDKAYFNGTTWERIVGSDLASLYLALGGGTLTGALTLADDPTNALEASPKQYADKVTSRHNEISGGATLGANELYKVNYIDATAGTAAIELDDASDDDWIAVRKKDSTSNRVTVSDSGGTELAWLSAQHDVAFFVWRDSAWAAVHASIAPIHDVFTASGTYTKPPLVRRVQVVAIGAGGGGGSGRRGAAASARFPGQGGAAGSLARLDVRASKLGATVAVTIGAGGAGGPAVSVDSTDGSSGTAGGASSFGSHLAAPGGTGGNPGGTSGAPALSSASTLGTGAPAPVATSATVASSPPSNSAISGSGGNGGGVSSGDTALDGAAGAAASVASTQVNGGAAGGAPGGVGSNGGAIADTELQYGGSGGGGGGGSTIGAAGSGGNGGAPGGGGGGGGASANGFNSGAGGNGARGEVRVTTYF